jgi:Zn-dependent peptidase ImmA (M78 family)
MLSAHAVRLVLAAALSFSSANHPALVPELAAPNLSDTAMAEMTADGPVILYNPALYRAAGAAREFVRAHEYGHVLLGHLKNVAMMRSDEGRAEAEAEADCFASCVASREAVLAMARLVRSLPPERRDRIYGTKQERARRILSCAGLEATDELQ